MKVNDSILHVYRLDSMMWKFLTGKRAEFRSVVQHREALYVYFLSFLRIGNRLRQTEIKYIMRHGPLFDPPRDDSFAWSARRLQCMSHAITVPDLGGDELVPIEPGGYFQLTCNANFQSWRVSVWNESLNFPIPCAIDNKVWRLQH